MTITLLTISLLGMPHAWAKRTVCTATLNSKEEREIFRARLPAADFDFVELTDHAKPGPDNAAWFDEACAAKVQCDVLMISGHFAGDFFGSSQLSLKLDPLENHSCQNTCDGVLKRPKEIFLFGCNTLATKERDKRTPDEYRRDLLKHNRDIDPKRVEQLVQARYGAMGDSYRERMRRVFTGVPHIYGFDSSAPSGATVTPFLNSYLKDVGNYRDHLAKIEGQALVPLITKANQQLMTPKSGITAAFRTTAFSRCTGLSPNDPEYRLRALVCPLYDTNLSPTARLRHGRELLNGPDAVTLAPSVMAVVQRIQTDGHGDGAVVEGLKEFGADPKVRALVENLDHGLVGSPLMSVDVELFKYNIGVTSKAELLAKTKGHVLPILKNLREDTAEGVCSIAEKMRVANAPIAVTADEVNLKLTETPLGTAIFMCVETEDPRITTAAAKSLSKSSSGQIRQAQFYAFMKLPGEADAKLKLATREANNKDRALAGVMNAYIFAHGTAAARAKVYPILLKTPNQAYNVAETIVAQKIKDEKMARLALDVALRDEASRSNSLAIMARLLPDHSPVWAEAMRKNKDKDVDTILYEMRVRNIHDPHATDYVVERMKNPPSTADSYTLMAYLTQAPLSPAQVQTALATVRADPGSDGARMLRYALNKQDVSGLGAADRQVLQGPTRGLECQRSTNNEGEAAGWSCTSVERE